jgi:hypothetical protein
MLVDMQNDRWFVFMQLSNVIVNRGAITVADAIKSEVIIQALQAMNCIAAERQRNETAGPFRQSFR